MARGALLRVDRVAGLSGADCHDAPASGERDEPTGGRDALVADGA